MALKKQWLLRAAIAVLLLFFSCSPRPQVLHNKTKGLTDPRIHYGKLQNGFQYVLIKNQTPKNRVSVHLDVFAGSMNETEDQQGLAHYLEHMVFNGSEHFKPGELVEYFQSIGMDFGGDANANTSFFNTVYDLSLPKGNQEYIDDALTVISDYARGALLLQDEVDRERGIILAEKQERDSVSYRSFKKSLAFELPGSGIPKRFPIGLEKILKKADSNQLKAFYDKWYRPDNMVLIMVGDFDPESVEKSISKHLASFKSRAHASDMTHPLSTRWEPHQGIKGFYHYEPESGETQVTIETLNWVPFKPQTVADLKAQTLVELANMIIQNRLERMVQSRKADFSEGDVYSGIYLRHLHLSAITGTCKAGAWKKTLEQIEIVLKQAIEFGLDQNEYDRVKADYLAMLDTLSKQESTRKSEAIARQLISRINQQKLLLSPTQKRDLLTPFIKSVSKQDIHQALKKAWAANHRLILVSGNSKIDETNPEAAIEKTYQNIVDQHIDPYQGYVSKPFPYLMPKKNKDLFGVKQISHINALGITRVVYSNNVQLFIKQTAFKKNQFLFKVNFGYGQFDAPIDQPALAMAAQSTIEQSGLGQLTKDQLEEALAGKDIGFGFDIDDTGFSFSGDADPAHAESVLQLIYHFLMDPGIRKDALDLSKSRYRQEYDSLKRTAEGIIKIKGMQFFAGGQPQFGLPTPKAYADVTIDQIKKWVNPAFKQSPIQINIVGDIDPDLFIKLADRYIGSVSKHDPFQPQNFHLKNALHFPAKEKRTFGVDTKIDTGIIRVAFLTDDFWDISQSRRLSILSRVISEKLRVKIREELGAAYSPYAYNDPSLVFDGFGLLNISVTCKPENQERVFQKLKEIISDLQHQGVTQKDVDRVLKPVVNHIHVLRETNNYWLGSVLEHAALHPQKFNWAVNMEKDYASIDPVDLNRLIKKYLKMENSSTFFVRPGE